MTDTVNERSPLWVVRAEYGLSRERVAALLEPPVSSKTIERWEKGLAPLPRRRIKEFARIYELPQRELKAKLNGGA